MKRNNYIKHQLVCFTNDYKSYIINHLLIKMKNQCWFIGIYINSLIYNLQFIIINKRIISFAYCINCSDV